MAPTEGDAPPSYAQATGSSSRTHETRNGIPPERRRSMEDEMRPLPQGWVRQFDPESEHQFFVDTTKDPPRSIWHHPHDDDEYLNSLTAEERNHVTRMHRSVSLKDIEAESTDEETGEHSAAKKTRTAAASHSPKSANAIAGSVSAPPGPPPGHHEEDDDHPGKVKKFGRKLKDRLTHSTHEERFREREKRAREEEEAYRLHLAFRQALSKAVQTGQPQYLGKDKDGRDMYIEPPNGPTPVGARGVPGGSVGLNPYSQGPYANPNARFLRPDYAYQRPYGYGYGGGYGLPLAGGLLGGALLGSLLLF